MGARQSTLTTDGTHEHFAMLNQMMASCVRHEELSFTYHEDGRNIPNWLHMNVATTDKDDCHHIALFVRRPRYISKQYLSKIVVCNKTQLVIKGKMHYHSSKELNKFTLTCVKCKRASSNWFDCNLQIKGYGDIYIRYNAKQ